MFKKGHKIKSTNRVAPKDAAAQYHALPGHEDYMRSAKTGTHRRGKLFLIRHLAGRTLTRHQAIQAKCFDCNGMGDMDECDLTHCSLYPYSQFKTVKATKGMPKPKIIPIIDEIPIKKSKKTILDVAPKAKTGNLGWGNSKLLKKKGKK